MILSGFEKDERGITDKLYNLIIQRGQALLKGNLEEIKEIDNRIRKQKKLEKKEYQNQITRRDPDTRDLHLGIKRIKSEFQPCTYKFKHHSRHGTVKSSENAEYAAEYLQDVTWGKRTNKGLPGRGAAQNL